MTSPVKRVCVFAGSSPGAKIDYREAAESLGVELVGRGYGLVYGGGRVGLMGALADAVLAAGGHVVGVIPSALMGKEVAHEEIQDLEVVSSMHERKRRMADLASAFIALPGGMGTLEELAEIATWAQLGIHSKPCGVVNAAGYYDALLAYLDRATEERFLRAEHRGILQVADSAAGVLDLIEAYQPRHTGKWMDRDQT